MERVVVLGSVGAGKSVLAERLARKTGLPVVHLDRLFWRPGWTPAPRHEAVRALDEAVASDRWILDGNFLEGGDGRFDRADTVGFLDFPRRTCLWHVVKRRVLEGGRPRPDLPEGCDEGIDRAVLRWIWQFPSDDRARVLDILQRLDDRVAVHRLRSRRDMRRFLDSVTA